MLNVSRGDVAYTLVDLDGPPSEDALRHIREIKGILSARVVPMPD
jgi:D-3-phosphoglycerate dehydrogenase